MVDPFSLKPLRVKLNLEPRIEEAFSELIHQPWGRMLAAGAWQPAIDVYETEDAYIIEADLSGVAPENVEVRVDDHHVTICGTRQSVTWTQSGQSLHVERAHGQFCRSLQLMHAVDLNGIEKTYENGILHLRLPKTAFQQSS